MLINFDSDLVMRDFYYPYVGMMNQIEGPRNTFGFWSGGRFNWLDEPGWRKRLGYLADTLVTDCEAVNEGFGLALTLSDAVHYRHDLLVRKVVLRNLLPEERELRVFLANDFNIDESDIGDTALFDPDLRAVYHYKRKRCFIIDGRFGDGAAEGRGEGITQFSTGRKRFAGAEGTWRDAEDGRLEGHPISQGSVDSAIGFDLKLPAGGTETLYCWIAIGVGFDSARAVHGLVVAQGPERLLQETATFWRSWVAKEDRNLGCLPPELAAFFRRSVLVVRTQVDNRGGILAANDSDILRHNRDHYSYVWPRDGALVAYALDQAGYHALTARFFRFCERAISSAGFLWHKYHPNGSVGSSWHPWVPKAEFVLPVQEDETASVLWALGHHYRRSRDIEFVDSLFPTLIEPAAEFLMDYRDPETGLPRPSWDLWEERQGVFTYTTASVWAGLQAAASLGDLFGDPAAARWREAAESMREAALSRLYDVKLGRFLRGLYVGVDGPSPDYTLDASLFGVVMFGFLPPRDERVVRTMQLVRDKLWVKTDVGGIARYTSDYYFRKSDDVERVPGNPWIICTLWLARWYVAKAETAEELKVALTILEWVRSHAMPGGHLAEQLHPYSGHSLSVAPLTWSHAEVINTVMEFIRKANQLGVTVAPDGEDIRRLPCVLDDV